jgi:hypothetical protein
MDLSSNSDLRNNSIFQHTQLKVFLFIFAFVTFFNSEPNSTEINNPIRDLVDHGLLILKLFQYVYTTRANRANFDEGWVSILRDRCITDWGNYHNDQFGNYNTYNRDSLTGTLLFFYVFSHF